MRIRFLGIAGGLLASVVAIGLAVAQVAAPPSVQSMFPTDLVQLGRAGVQSAYASVGQVSSQQTYTSQVPLTGFSITGPNPSTATMLVINPAGTLATGTLTMPAAPNDGGAFCFMSTQTQTALTVTANTGQTMGGAAVTAAAAYVPVCWRYFALTSTWGRVGS